MPTQAAGDLTHEFAPHRHEALVIAMTEVGGSVIRSRGSVEHTGASLLLVFNPDEPHSGWMGASPRWRYRSLYLEQVALDGVADGLGIDKLPYFTRNCLSDDELIAAFLALHQAFEDQQDTLLQHELLLTTFGKLFRKHGSGGLRVYATPTDQIRLRTAIDFIHGRLASPISLHALSRTLQVTPYQLIRLFKRTTGLTPHAYVTQLRLDAARRYLASGIAIGEAAAAAGFYDQSALTRYFKRAYGLTPLQFAHAVRQ
jgi:AraC-like DNA-binding protein